MCDEVSLSILRYMFNKNEMVSNKFRISLTKTINRIELTAFNTRLSKLIVSHPKHSCNNKFDEINIMLETYFKVHVHKESSF